MTKIFSFYYNFKRKLYLFLLFKCKFCVFPLSLLLCSIEKCGIIFYYYGDEITWLWPWRRKDNNKYISVLFSGTGEFGDAKFISLKEIFEEWKKYEKLMKEYTSEEI